MPSFLWFRKSTTWVWLKGSSGDGSDEVGFMEPVSPAWWVGGSENQGVCTQKALGKLGQWRKSHCAGQYHFICEKEVTGKAHWTIT